MRDYQAASIVSCLENLLPSVEISYSAYPRGRLQTAVPAPAHVLRKDAGEVVADTVAHLWFVSGGDRVAVLRVARAEIPFSAAERRVLSFFSTAIGAFLIREGARSVRTATRIATRYSFSEVLVSKLATGSRTSGAFWTSALILSLLRDLSLRSYESQPCRSGFLFQAGQPRRWAAESRGAAFSIREADCPDG